MAGQGGDHGRVIPVAGLHQHVHVPAATVRQPRITQKPTTRFSGRAGRRTGPFCLCARIAWRCGWPARTGKASAARLWQARRARGGALAAWGCWGSVAQRQRRCVWACVGRWVWPCPWPCMGAARGRRVGPGAARMRGGIETQKAASLRRGPAYRGRRGDLT